MRKSAGLCVLGFGAVILSGCAEKPLMLGDAQKMVEAAVKGVRVPTPEQATLCIAKGEISPNYDEQYCSRYSGGIEMHTRDDREFALHITSVDRDGKKIMLLEVSINGTAVTETPDGKTAISNGSNRFIVNEHFYNVVPSHVRDSANAMRSMAEKMIEAPKVTFKGHTLNGQRLG